MFARLGFVARGIVCIVIGAIALMVAFGVARHEPDRAGAIEAIAAKPFGYLLLWILVIGFLGMAVWRFCPGRGAAAEPDRGPPGQGTGLRHRLCHRVRQHLDVVVHGTRPAAGDASARDYTAHVLSPDGGRVIVAVAGIALVALGIVMAVRGFGAEFTAAPADGMDEPRHARRGGQARPGGIRRARWSSPASGSLPLTRLSPMMRPGPRAWTGCSARSPSRPSARGCSSWSYWD
jgi:Domain of Unknown Function (DUF1206)